MAAGLHATTAVGIATSGVIRDYTFAAETGAHGAVDKSFDFYAHLVLNRSGLFEGDFAGEDDAFYPAITPTLGGDFIEYTGLRRRGRGSKSHA